MYVFSRIKPSCKTWNTFIPSSKFIISHLKYNKVFMSITAETETIQHWNLKSVQKMRCVLVLWQKSKCCNYHAMSQESCQFSLLSQTFIFLFNARFWWYIRQYISIDGLINQTSKYRNDLMKRLRCLFSVGTSREGAYSLLVPQGIVLIRDRVLISFLRHNQIFKSELSYGMNLHSWVQ